MHPQDQFMDYGPLGNNVNSNCIGRAVSERFASGVYSAAVAATEATIIQEDDYRPPFPVGGGVSIWRGDMTINYDDSLGKPR
jgi:hypothetical protein